jgi:hypothetical protein
MTTTIRDMSNDDGKDGLLKDVYLDKKGKRKKKVEEGRKRAETMVAKYFGPHHG